MRAAEADNLGTFIFAVDDVTCTATLNSSSVPALSEWRLIAMAAVLGLAGLIVARRKKVAA